MVKYICEVCDKEFKDSYEAKKHEMKRVTFDSRFVGLILYGKEYGMFSGGIEEAYPGTIECFTESDKVDENHEMMYRVHVYKHSVSQVWYKSTAAPTFRSSKEIEERYNDPDFRVPDYRKFTFGDCREIGLMNLPWEKIKNRI